MKPNNLMEESLFVLLLLVVLLSNARAIHSIIDGVYAVHFNDHYSNKSQVVWGKNDDNTMSVLVMLSDSASIYNCSNTDNYHCDDVNGCMYDWNKLFGKSRCGDYMSYHKDSDRFVFRRCSDSSCDAYVENENRIQLGAYSYDDSNKPYDGQHPDLLKTFKTTILPNYYYNLTIAMNVSGISSFILSDPYNNNEELETQYTIHNNKCEKDFSKGVLAGLYFGGTCTAPEDVVVKFTQTI